MMRSEVVEHEKAHPPLPGHKPHSCTDTVGLVIFLGFLGGLGYVESYAWKHGDIRKLTHGFDYQGNMCVGKTPLTFWCLDQSGGAPAVKYPICVASCPGSNATTQECFDPMLKMLTSIQDYETHKFGPYCMPKEKALLKQVKQDLAGSTPIGKVLRAVRNIAAAWIPLLGAAVVAIITGYVYLFMLDHCAELLVFLCMSIIIIAPLGTGGYFLYVGLQGGEDGISGTGDDQTDLAIGSGFIGLGVLSLCFVLYLRSGLNAAVGCIEAACECMFQETTLMLEPFIALAIKVALLIVLVYGFAELVSTGQIEMIGDYGISRDFKWTHEQEIMMGFYLVMVVWLLEFTNALSQYVLAFATQGWYFTPYIRGSKLDAPAFGICKGYANALFYHVGTLALGSLIISTFRILRMAVGVVAAAAEEGGNPCAACLGKLCFCAVSCFKNFLEFLNKSAYMDVAITSNNFCHAAGRAVSIIAEEDGAVAALNGAQLIFQIAGFGIITLTGFFATMFSVKWISVFNDPNSQFYVSDPKPVGFAAGVMSACIGASFMVVFDTVGDTILYCFATEQRRHKQVGAQVDHSRYGTKPDPGMFGFFFGGEDEEFEDEKVSYAPPRLRELIAAHHDEMSG